MERDSACLSAEDRERLGEIIDASLAVWERHQFYEWAQGLLQCLVPHDVLVCGVARGDAMQLDCFAAAPLAESARPRQDLLALALERWQASGKPVFLPADGGRGRPRHFALHALRGADGRTPAFFAFGGPVPADTARQAYLVEIVVPYVYCTYARVLGRLGGRPPALRRLEQTVTRREAEILGWIQEGKTNGDIARILHLSPWTVKNHVQNMLKKLGVHNRAQAVSRGIATRQIRH